MKSSSNLLLLLLGICSVTNQGLAVESTLEKRVYTEHALAMRLPRDVLRNDTVRKVGNMTLDASPGQTVWLHCDISGNDPEESPVQWFKGAEEDPIRLFEGTLRQTTDRRFNMNPSNYTLTIDHVNANDSGKFTCEFLEHDRSTKVVHQLNVVEGGNTIIISSVVIIVVLLVLLTIVGVVFYIRKRKTNYQPANPTQMAFSKN
uniref:Ig-like domain-containing protein n=1 Tax=Lygus hesperus TaxID=30085 RepID=A0A0K8T1I4_LYGHE